jgi:UDP-N-acetylmuramate dehydrogenase
LNAVWRTQLAEALGDAVQLDCPLAPRVAFRIGGPADAFVRPRTAEQLAVALSIAREQGVPVTVLGTGSNVLVSDLGIRGMTLRLSGELADVHVGPIVDGRAEIEAGAGALNAPLVALALNLGLVGIEFLATIPGTFGGALIMNAGAHGGEIGLFVESVTLVDGDLKVETRSRDQCGFAYRSSAFSPGEVLTGARLLVPKGDPEQARAHLAQMRAARKKTQPSEHPNAGSIFKNPPGEYAGRMIEACGLKGRSTGGALISPLHANFIVNQGGATATDVIALADEARRAVRDRFGVDLEWEVRRVGEWPGAASSMKV